LDIAEYQLAYGTDLQKQRLLTSFVPAMMKGLAAIESDEASKQESDAIARMLASMGDRPVAVTSAPKPTTSPAAPTAPVARPRPRR
jgi:hypothetical protein